MNIQKYITSLLSLLLLISFTSCDKDKENGPNIQAMLTNGIWIGTAAYKDGNNMTQQYADQGLDIRNLEINFTLSAVTSSTTFRVIATYNDGVNVGRPDLGTWRLVDDKTIIFEENTPNETVGEILLLTNNDLRVKGYIPGLELRFVKKEI